MAAALMTLSVALPGQGDPPKRGPVKHHRRHHHHDALWQWRLGSPTDYTATAYCQGASSATTDGRGVRWGLVATYGYRLGTRVALDPPVSDGAGAPLKHIFVVGDRPGGKALDVWLPNESESLCGGAFPRGERVRVVLGRRR